MALNSEHVLRRLTYGPNAASRAEIAKLGVNKWLALQLSPGRIADPLGDRVTALYPRLRWSTAQVHTLHGQNNNYYEFLYEPGLQHIGRAIWSKRQLFEIMVEFWSDHLHVPAPAEKGSWGRHRYDADVIRKYALGNFQDMLVASSQHLSMIAYLDLDKSTNTEPNENYARELMELHTLGVGGGYSEKDVKQVALLLTGWEIPWPSEVLRWNASRHYTKPVTVMGRKIANGSGQTGHNAQINFFRWLSMHPATAKHICRKLAIRFVSDNPSNQLVNALAATYLRNKTAIVPVLRQLFTSGEFQRSANLKTRRPFERLIATVRVLDAQFNGNKDGLQQLYWNAYTLGHNPFNWPTPDGFPDTADHWQSPATALQVINDSSGLVHNWWQDKLKLPGPAKWLPKQPATRAAAIDATSRKIFNRLPTAQEKAAANTLLASTKLTTSLSGGGWNREETVALSGLLLLNSPDFLTR